MENNQETAELITAPKNLQEQIFQKAKVAKATGADVEVIGTWVWAYYLNKPTAEIRNVLKEQHFRWNPNRNAWQWAGTKSRSTKAQKATIASKYGCVLYEEEVTA